MKRAVFLPVIILFSFLTNKALSQPDSLKTEKSEPFWYLGFGLGPNTRGGNLEISFTVFSTDYLGGSLNLRTGYVKLKDIPADYDGMFGRLAPYNDFLVLSFNIVKKFTTSEEAVRFGLEAGPSWIRYNLTELELNPNYGVLFQYKYDKVHTLENTLGVSFAAKAEFPFSRFAGAELGVFTVINSIQPVLGLNGCLNFGKVRR